MDEELLEELKLKLYNKDFCGEVLWATSTDDLKYWLEVAERAAGIGACEGEEVKEKILDEIFSRARMYDVAVLIKD